jgi:hypothetical protein
LLEADDSRHGEFGVAPHLGRLERQHDVFFRDAGLEEFIREAQVAIILFDPDFAVLDSREEDSVGNSVARIHAPTLPPQAILIVLGVRDYGGLDLGFFATVEIFSYASNNLTESISG